MEKWSETLNFRVSKRLLETLKKQAEASDLKLSEYVRAVLRENAGFKTPLKRAN